MYVLLSRAIKLTARVCAFSEFYIAFIYCNQAYKNTSKPNCLDHATFTLVCQLQQLARPFANTPVEMPRAQSPAAQHRVSFSSAFTATRGGWINVPAVVSPPPRQLAGATPEYFRPFLINNFLTPWCHRPINRIKISGENSAETRR